MPTSSLEELKRQVATGQYAVDPNELAGAILSKFAVVRRVGRGLTREADERAPGNADVGHGRYGPGRRRERSATEHGGPRSRDPRN